MSRSLVRFVVLTVLLHTAIARAVDRHGAGAPACPSLPGTIQVVPVLQPAVSALRNKSETLRRQCAAIAAAPHVRVVVSASHVWRLSHSAPAGARLERYIRSGSRHHDGCDRADVSGAELEGDADVPSVVTPRRAPVVP